MFYTEAEGLKRNGGSWAMAVHAFNPGTWD